MVTIGLSLENKAQTNKPPKKQPPLYQNEQGRLAYTPDSLGNRIPDFSYCGYQAGNQTIPNVPVRIVVPALKGDATLRIQSAIDYVASLPLDKEGFRGTVLLGKGTFEIMGGLFINVSGVVLRGSDMGENGTIVIGTGVSRENLITVAGKNDRKIENKRRINDPYVPVNATKLHVANSESLKVGDRLQIHRPSSKEWIQTIGNEDFGGGITTLGWKPGQRDIFWDRVIVALTENEITIDAPLTTALDSTFGGGYLSTYQWPGRIRQVGIENLQLISSFDKTNPKDEDHRWVGFRLKTYRMLGCDK
ncbi:MAG: hypothetical protein R2822_21280 [Spirosomataceae bacterium]